MFGLLLLGLSSANVEAAIYAKFGSIDGAATEPNHKDWTNLQEFEITIGSLPSGSREDPPLRVFGAAFSFVVDSTYVPLASDSFKGTFIDSILVEHTYFNGYDELTHLAYEIKNALLGPINLRHEVSSAGTAPLVSGTIISAEELVTTYSGYDANGNAQVDITTTLRLNEPPAVLASVSALQGDYNLDNVVDADDYSVWRQLFGSTSVVADGNGDGTVNLVDYTVWRDNLGASVNGLNANLAAGVSVPEPGTLLLAVLAVGWCFASALKKSAAAKKCRRPRKMSQC